MSVSEWINKDLLEKAFRNFYNDKEIEILGYSAKAAVPVGDNYTSDLFRVNVSYSRGKTANKESMGVIVKIQIKGTILEALNDQMNLFGKEIEMYSITLPKMYAALGSEYENSLAPSCLLTTMDPISILVVQDLQPLGYVMASRQDGLDMEHCKLVMKKIAAFHAASVVITDNDPSVINNYHAGLFTEALTDWMVQGVESVTEACMKWPDMEKYAAKLRKFDKETIFKKVRESDDRKLGGFNVLNHGDLWMNNMLFLYHPDGKLKDLQFIDYQIVKYGSPAIDLHYFFATSPSSEVKRLHIYALLDIYYGYLLATLAGMNYALETVPSREDFRKDFNSRAFYGVMASATVAPLVKATSRKDATFEDLMTNNEEGGFRHHCYTNDLYEKEMKLLLSFYDNLGSLN